MTPLRILLIGLMLAAAPGLASAQHAPPAYDSLGADWGAQQDEVRACVAAGRCVPAVGVIVKIRQLTPGRPLDVTYTWQSADAAFAGVAPTPPSAVIRVAAIAPVAANRRTNLKAPLLVWLVCGLLGLAAAGVILRAGRTPRAKSFFCVF